MTSKPNGRAPGPPPRLGDEIAVAFPYSPAALEMRRRAAPSGQFDRNRRLWVMPLSEARAFARAVERRLEQCRRIAETTPYSGIRRTSRREAEELSVVLPVLKRDPRLWPGG